MKQIQVGFLFLKHVCFYFPRRSAFLLSVQSNFSTDEKWQSWKELQNPKSQGNIF